MHLRWSRAVVAAVAVLALVVGALLLSTIGGSKPEGSVAVSPDESSSPTMTFEQVLAAIDAANVPCSDWYPPIPLGQKGGLEGYCLLQGHSFHQQGEDTQPGEVVAIVAARRYPKTQVCQAVPAGQQTHWVVRGVNWTVLVEANDAGAGMDVQSSRPIADAIADALGGGLVCPL